MCAPPSIRLAINVYKPSLNPVNQLLLCAHHASDVWCDVWCSVSSPERDGLVTADACKDVRQMMITLTDDYAVSAQLCVRLCRWTP